MTKPWREYSDFLERWENGLWEECYDDPLLFVVEVFGLPDKTQGCPTCNRPAIRATTGEGVASQCDCPGVEPWQAAFLKDVGQYDRVSARSGHGVGKTTTFAWIGWWFLATRRTCKVPVISPSENQLRDALWPEFRKWHGQMPKGLASRFETRQETVVNKADPGNAFIVARTAPKHKPEALQGFHQEQLMEYEGEKFAVANLLVLLDEASGIEEAFYEVNRGALSGKGTKLAMAGNPTRTAGSFYDSHHKLRTIYRCHHVSCLDVKRAQGHIEEIKAQYGEGSNAWRVRVLGEFPTSSDETIIPLSLVMSAIGRDVPPLDYYPIWGLDVARYGDDRTALAKRQANALLEPVKAWKNLDTLQVVGRLRTEYEETKPEDRPKQIMVDVIGVGAGVYDVAKAQGLPVYDVNVGEAASSRENCMRLRDELWFLGREWFLDRSCTMPNDEALISELTNVTYSFTVTGKFVAERKQEMKDRGVPSPDLADAFLLTFAGSLQQRQKFRRKPRRPTDSNWAA